MHPIKLKYLCSMIELSKHIEALLLEHDCVIVPKLGGFVTQYAPAYKIEDEQLFLPPHRDIGFNAQLTLNDGLLVQSFMQTYDVSYAEALHLIDDVVADMKKALAAEGEYVLNGIGVLSTTLSGTLSFTPNEAGVVAPDFYGLRSLSIKKRVKSSVDNGARSDFGATAQEGRKKNNTYTFRINRELCNYAAAVIVAVFFYFLWATPVGVTNLQQANLSSAYGVAMPIAGASSETAENPSTCTFVQAKNEVKADIQNNMPAKNASAADNKAGERGAESNGVDNKTSVAPAQKTAGETPEMVDAPFTIVLISDIPLSNAKAFAEGMKGKGLLDAEVLVKRKMTRVVCGHYQTEADAVNALRQLRSKHPEFKESWVLNVK